MEKSSFFNAELVGESYDRTYLAEDYVEYFASFIGNGVFPNPSNNLQVIADGTSMNISLSMGKAWINGYYYRNTDELILPITPADGVLNRIDRVVLRLDFLNREIKCYVKKGVFASNPVAIELQRDADMYEIGIADIKVNKGIIKITQADITDLRQNSNYCGIVHGTVNQVDVTTLFNQYEKALQLKEQGFEEEFTAWFNNIKGQLEGDVATNLAGQIENINEQLGEMENKKINYTDLTPITTTGTSSDYVATIPTNIVEVTIVPHINNLVGATLNSVPILDREGKPIGKDVLKMNIPTKLVRVGSNFFIASGGDDIGVVKIKGNFDNATPLRIILQLNTMYKPDMSGIYTYTLSSSEVVRTEVDMMGNNAQYVRVPMPGGSASSVSKILCDNEYIAFSRSNIDKYIDIYDLNLNLIESFLISSDAKYNKNFRGISLKHNRYVTTDANGYIAVYDRAGTRLYYDQVSTEIDSTLTAVHFINEHLIIVSTDALIRVFNINNTSKASLSKYNDTVAALLENISFKEV